MKRKIFLILCTLIACVCLALGLAACGGTGGGTQGGNGGTQGGNDGNAEEQETHDWSDWEIVKEATCTEEGSRTRTCDECGKAETETIPAKDHTFNDSNVCKDCGFELVPTVGLEYELYEETEYPRGEYYRVKGMGTATDTDLVIPANHAGKAVKQIAAEAFNGKDALTSVYIPKGVAGIGMNAFSYCISLTALHIPASVTTIGKQAFYGCSKIKDITLGTNGITIGESAFENTAYYKNNKNWDNGALYIGAHLIATNDSLPSSYTVKEDTSSIATKAFANRSELKEIVLPYIRGKGTNIFSNSGVSKATATYDNLDLLPADQITDLTITSGTVYTLSQFVNVENLFVNTDWADNSFSIQEAPLAGLGKLKNLKVKWLCGRYHSYPMHTLFGDEYYSGSVEIKQDAKRTNQADIKNYYTAYLPAELETVTVLQGDLGAYMFSNCTMIKRFDLGEKIGKIDIAFWGCRDGVRVNYEGTVKQWAEQEKGCWSGLRDYNSDGGYEPAFVDFTIQNSSLSEINIPNDVTNIASYAFFGCKINRIEIPDSVTSIGDRAFGWCTSLTSVTIPNSVISIRDVAFYQCTSLTSVTVPDSVTSIGESAFSGCTKLTRVNITDLAAWCKIDFGGDTANPLYYAYHLYLKGEEVTTLTIPDVITEIKPFTFCGGAFTSVTIPDSVTSIGEDAFHDCYSLTSVTIPDSVTSIGERAFYYCTSLTSVTIGGSVTTIGKWAFEGCYKLIEVWNHSTLELKRGSANYGCIAYYAEQIYKGDEVGKQTVTDDGYIFYEDGEENYLLGYMGKETQLTLPTTSPSGKQYEIYRYAFYYCRSLTSVTIPDGVTSIGDYAFCDCKSLTSVTIGSGVTSIGEDAFCDCKSLTSVTIGSGVTSIGESAFNRIRDTVKNQKNLLKRSLSRA